MGTPGPFGQDVSGVGAISQGRIQEGIELALHPLLSVGHLMFLIFLAGPFFIVLP